MGDTGANVLHRELRIVLCDDLLRGDPLSEQIQYERNPNTMTADARLAATACRHSVPPQRAGSIQMRSRRLLFMVGKYAVLSSVVRRPRRLKITGASRIFLLKCHTRQNAAKAVPE